MNGTATVLQDVVRRESRSLLLYIGDSFPWTRDDQAPDLATLKNLIVREANAISDLGKFLVRKRITPPPYGSYPANFTSCNFIDIAYLLPRLLAAQEQSITALSGDIALMHDVEAKKHLEALLEVKRLSLAGLAALSSSHPHPASA